MESQEVFFFRAMLYLLLYYPGMINIDVKLNSTTKTLTLEQWFFVGLYKCTTEDEKFYTEEYKKFKIIQYHLPAKY